MKTIFVIGQCTLHWGRMEFGNIGNYYVIEPFFRELHRAFPNTVIKTTFQMSDDFQKNERVSCVPMDLYYGWKKDDLDNALKELAIAQLYSETGHFISTTPFIEEVMCSDLIIDYSGDIWGQNADLVGENRFLVGLIKDRIAQLLKKKTAMIAGSPGPFNYDDTLDFAKLVFDNFEYISIREPVSRQVLENFGFNVHKIKDAACPAFLFEPASQQSIQNRLKETVLETHKRPIIGFILCGWNMLRGPFSRNDWKEEEFVVYVEALRGFIKKHNVDICFMSHSNGFELPPHFKPIHGRDYPIAKQLYEIMRRTDVADHVHLLDGIYNAKETKAIVANYDMLISGRVHGAIAGLSQNIPTVIIDYGHEPKAHKLRGFAIVAGIEDYIASPGNQNDFEIKIENCWEKRADIHRFLKSKNIEVAKQVHSQFDDLKGLLKTS